MTHYINHLRQALGTRQVHDHAVWGPSGLVDQLIDWLKELQDRLNRETQHAEPTEPTSSSE